MKKIYIVLLLTSNLLLNGCANTISTNPIVKSTEQDENTISISTYSIEEESLSSAETALTSAETTEVEQGGPYGRISLSIPTGWHYEIYPMDSEKLPYGLYGIQFFPEDVADGYVNLVYIDDFGVCGTGLAEETLTIAGKPANIGTYDNHKYWDFITFGDDYSGIVALTYKVENWWEIYSEQVLEILNTLIFDTSVKEGEAYIYSADSEADKIGLYFTLKKISPSGATLVFHQYDENAPTGTLEYGDSFVIEVWKNNIWEEVPIVTDDNYAFHDIAYTIPNKDTTERELDWAWLYGMLQPGNYRIKKEILDFRKTGDYDKYMVYAQFIVTTPTT
ncbi:MAG: hypothetical protein K1W16_00610 [Lachnospiraceae bacterium]|jgi:hypothetical protein